jgi:hypothetical protein
MTKNEFEAWVEAMESSVIGHCRYCGSELHIGEVDICDECFEAEQLRT